METPETLYSYFFKALTNYVKDGGHGSIKDIAGKVGISGAYLSQIVSEKVNKRATPQKQKEIAKACGYEFDEFLALGRTLLNNEIPHGKSSGIDHVKNQDAKVGSGMEANEKDAILRHCLEELAALREEIKYLREERNHFRDRILELEKQQVQAPEEKKTAV